MGLHMHIYMKLKRLLDDPNLNNVLLSATLSGKATLSLDKSFDVCYNQSGDKSIALTTKVIIDDRYRPTDRLD